MTIDFFKYEGAGNDFIITDNRKGTFPVSDVFISALCDRRLGVGADGLMLLENDPESEFRMRYFNSDGHEATMCGNGGRCIALFAHHLGIGGKVKNFNAADGKHAAEIIGDDGLSGTVALRMRDVGIIRKIDDGFLLDTGSPHYVVFVEDVDKADVFGRGRAMRCDRELVGVEGANINFVEIAGVNEIRLRTYERGVEGETLACGTGAVASVIAAAVAGKSSGGEFTVHALGGDLKISFNTDNYEYFSDICLTGPARWVFRGNTEVKNFPQDTGK